MFKDLFVDILNMSYMGTVVILIVLLARILLKKSPKKYIYLLWSIPLIRLLIPFTFQSVMSLFPTKVNPISIEIGQSTEVVSDTVSEGMVQPKTGPIGTQTSPFESFLDLLVIVWLFVMVILLVKGLVSYYRLKGQLKTSTHIEENIYMSNQIETPLVVGIFKAKIYLPYAIMAEEKNFIILHENMHIERHDQLFRFIAYLALCIHWFNPLVWLAFRLSERDMEMACDEAVIGQLGERVKKDYSRSLLDFTIKKSNMNLSPLAFSEGDTKDRVKNVLDFKKPKVIFLVFIIIIVLILALGLLTNPMIEKTEIFGHQYQVTEVLNPMSVFSFIYTVDTAPSFSISSDQQFLIKEATDTEWTHIGSLYHIEMTKDDLIGYFQFPSQLDLAILSALEDIKGVYRVDSHRGTWPFYLFVETNDRLFLMYMYENQMEANDFKVRFMFSIETVESLQVSFSTSDLWASRTQYLGNNSAVSRIINQLQIPINLKYKGFALQTKDEPYGLTINFSELDSMDSSRDSLLEMDAYILFSLIENLEEIHMSVDDEEILSFSRQAANDQLGIDLYQASREEMDYHQVILNIIENVQNRHDVPIDSHLSFNENLLEQAIHQAIIGENASSNEGDAFESHINFVTEYDEKQVVVYGMALQLNLNVNSQGIETIGGSHIPYRLTFKRDIDLYELEEYWIPRDGSLYGEDIKDVFPDSIQDQAMDTQRYVLRQNQAIYKEAVQVYNLNTDQVLDRLIEEIMSSPKESSNPLDYIDTHYIAYREMTYYGDYTLKYINDYLRLDKGDLKTRLLEILENEMNG